jgi:Multicopper oxidase
MPMGRVRIAFDADNPGRWAFHCHNLYHMMTGVMMEFRYEGIAVSARRKISSFEQQRWQLRGETMQWRKKQRDYGRNESFS